MLSFRNLKNKANGLAVKLLRDTPTPYKVGFFFCSCIPSLGDLDLISDIEALQLTAECLEKFYEQPEEVKFNVLKGLYIIVLMRYDSTLKLIFYKYIVDVLLEHIGLDNLEVINPKDYEACLKQLEDFIRWVYNNRENLEINKLSLLLPTSIIVDIDQYLTPSGDVSNSWSDLLQ